MAYARLRLIDAARLAFECSYSPDLTTALKQAVPFQARRWDGDRKRWLIDPAYGPACADLAWQYLGVEVDVPAVPTTPPPPETRLIRLEYLGRCKTRDTGEVTAAGWTDGGWSVSIPESVLRAWFEPTNEPDAATTGGAPTLYGILTVKPTATGDEIKGAFRRLARVTHPDVNKEPDAAERFIALKDAYDVLSNDLSRRKYDLGLSFQAEFERKDLRKTRDWWGLERNGYAPPLRCGWVLGVGVQRVSGFAISQLLAWEAITNAEGQELVTSWPAGAKQFETRWV